MNHLSYIQQIPLAAWTISAEAKVTTWLAGICAWSSRDLHTMQCWLVAFRCWCLWIVWRLVSDSRATCSCTKYMVVTKCQEDIDASGAQWHCCMLFVHVRTMRCLLAGPETYETLMVSSRGKLRWQSPPVLWPGFLGTNAGAAVLRSGLKRGFAAQSTEPIAGRQFRSGEIKARVILNRSLQVFAVFSPTFSRFFYPM